MKKRGAVPGALTTQQRLAKARKVQSVLETIPQFRMYKSDDLAVELRSFTSKQLPAALLQWCFDLCKSNMLAFYGKVWGWDDKKKLKQLSSAASRFHVAFKAGGQDEAVAYVNYRLEREGDVALLYLYELQIAERAQRRGLGRFLMELLEEQARVLGLDKVVLTSLDANAAALQLYTKLGYAVDADDPSNMDPPQKPGYTILSKEAPHPRAPPAVAPPAALLL